MLRGLVREQLFSAPREQQPLERAWKQVAQATLFTRLKRTKNMQGLEGVGAAGTVLSAVFSSFLTVLCTSIAATANLSATESPNCHQSEERSTETVATPAVGKETIAQKAAIGGCPSSRLCYCKKCHDIIPTAMRVLSSILTAALLTFTDCRLLWKCLTLSLLEMNFLLTMFSVLLPVPVVLLVMQHGKIMDASIDPPH